MGRQSLQVAEKCITKRKRRKSVYSTIRKIKEIVNLMAVQVAVVVMMVLRDTEAGSWPTASVSHRQAHRNRHTRPTLAKPAFNWGAKDGYIEPRNLEMEVLNVHTTKMYEVLEEQRVPVIKN